MAVELAAAYLTLMPSLRGAQSSIESQLSGVDVSKPGARMGASLTASMSESTGEGLAKSLSSVGDKLEGAFAAVAKPAAAAFTGAVGAVIGATATGGWQRALNIENARGTLESLGFTAEQVESAMDSALKSVKGTAYGLDEAAKAASMLATSDVALGEDMDHALQAIAGTAAIAGTSMDDITDIFQVIASNEKLSANELNRLAQRGVNARAVLKQALGVDGEELKGMVKDGAIDFKTFMEAMYDAYGQAAYGANESFEGALMNVGAALNRLGEKFAAPLQQSLRGVFVSAIPAIDAVTASVGPLVDKFSDLANMVSGKASTFLDVFANRIAAASDGFDEFGNIAEGEAPGWKAWLDAIRDGVEETFGEGTVAKIEKAAVAFGMLGAAGPALKLASGGITAMSGVLKAFDKITPRIVGAATTMRNAIVRSFPVQFGIGFVEGLTEPIRTKFPVATARMGKFVSTTRIGLSRVGSSMLAMGAAISRGAILATGAVGGVALGILALGTAALKGGVDIQGGTAKVLQVMTELTSGLPQLAEQLSTELPGAFEQVAAAAPSLAKSFAVALRQISNSVPQMMQTLMTGIAGISDAIAPEIASMAAPMLKAGAQMFTSLMKSMAETAPSIIKMIPDLVNSLCMELGESGPEFAAACFELFRGIGSALNEVMPQVGTMMLEELPNIYNYVSSHAGDMKNAAIEFFGGLGQALGELAPKLGEAILYLVTHIPEIIGSAAGLMLEAGANFMKGFLDGLMGTDMDPYAAMVNSDWQAALESNLNMSEQVASMLDTSALISPTEEMMANAASAAGSYDTSGIGSGFSSGAASGIDVYAMTENARQMVRNAKLAAEDEAKIGSPSKVMQKFGNFWAEGAGVGIAQRARVMADETRKMVDEAIQSTRPLISGMNSRPLVPSYAFGGIGATSNNPTYNINVTAGSDGEDIARTITRAIKQQELMGRR